MVGVILVILYTLAVFSVGVGIGAGIITGGIKIEDIIRRIHRKNRKKVQNQDVSWEQSYR